MKAGKILCPKRQLSIVIIGGMVKSIQNTRRKLSLVKNVSIVLCGNYGSVR